MHDPITVIIIDDHAVVRQGVKAFLASQPDIAVVGDTGTGAEAITLIKELAPMVVLVDLVMPEMDGIELTRRIKQISPGAQVVVLTSFLEDEHIFPAIRAGALSYLLKDASADEIAATIRKAARREAVLHPRIAARLAHEVQGGQTREINSFTELSDREMEVLQLIAAGLTNAQIAAQLIIGEGTVKSHVTNILSKLHLVDRTQAAIFAWRQGIVRRS